MSHLLTRIVGLLAGASIYLILPIRALNQPAINWFNPVTINSFIQLISGSLYQSYFSVNYVIGHARAWAGILFENLGFPGVIIGIYALLDYDSNKKFKLLVAWIFLIYGLFALFYVTYDSYIYLIPTILAFSIWIGLSIESFASFIIERWRPAGWILVPLVVIFFFLRINSAIPKVNASNDGRADLFAQQVFDTVPENAMIFTKDDQSTFSLWYYHFALEKRADIKVISQGLLGFNWYRQTLRETYPSLKIPETANLAPTHLIDQNPGNPFCYVEYPETIKLNCFGNKI